MHEELIGLGVLQQKPEASRSDARFLRWQRKALERQDLIGIPSAIAQKAIDYPQLRAGILDKEEQFKAQLAELAYRICQEYFGPRPIKTLDIGCGALVFARHLLEEFAKGGQECEYVAVDQCQTLLEDGTNKLALGKLDLAKSLRLFCSFATELPPELGLMDLVIHGQTYLHYVEDDKADWLDWVIAEQCRLVPVGGLVFLYGPFCDHNPQYRREPRKNPDTLIRYEQSVLKKFAAHHINFVDRWLHQYFEEEWYSTLLLQKTRVCT